MDGNNNVFGASVWSWTSGEVMHQMRCMNVANGAVLQIYHNGGVIASLQELWRAFKNNA